MISVCCPCFAFADATLRVVACNVGSIQLMGAAKANLADVAVGPLRIQAGRVVMRETCGQIDPETCLMHLKQRGLELEMQPEPSVLPDMESRELACAGVLRAVAAVIFESLGVDRVLKRQLYLLYVALDGSFGWARQTRLSPAAVVAHDLHCRPELSVCGMRCAFPGSWDKCIAAFQGMIYPLPPLDHMVFASGSLGPPELETGKFRASELAPPALRFPGLNRVLMRQTAEPRVEVRAVWVKADDQGPSKYGFGDNNMIMQDALRLCRALPQLVVPCHRYHCCSEVAGLGRPRARQFQHRRLQCPTPSEGRIGCSICVCGVSDTSRLMQYSNPVLTSRGVLTGGCAPTDNALQ